MGVRQVRVKRRYQWLRVVKRQMWDTISIDAATHKRGITRSAMVEILARQHLFELA